MGPRKQAPRLKAEQEPDSELVGTSTSVEKETRDNGKPPKKRTKAEDTGVPNKAPRRSGRGAAKSAPSQKQLLVYLLSNDAEEYCRPDDESEDIRNGQDLRTYSSSMLNPFEELLSAAILSRPISHRLGLRTIRTVLNAPYAFNSAKAINEAGEDKIHEAIWKARTQHKQKTVEEIGQVANVVMKRFTATDDKEGTELRKALDDHDGKIENALASIRDSIKGLGSTAMDIFRRRVQWLWDVAYPFVDDRTSQSLSKLGLPEEAMALEKLVEEHWKELPASNLAGTDEATRKRRAFVVILERTVCSDLEKKIDKLLEAAAAAS